MQDFKLNSNWSDQGQRRRFLGWEISGWMLFGLGAGVALLIVNLAVVKPLARQFDALQAQVTALTSAVDKLSGQSDGVAATNSLLARLEEQGRQNVAAAAALSELEAIRSRLILEHESNAAALQSLGGLVEMKDVVWDQNAQMPFAHEALSQLVDLKEQLVDGQTDAAAAGEVLDRWAAMQRQLAQSRLEACEARDTANDLLSLSDNLLCRGTGAQSAEVALQRLLSIRERLDDQGTGLDLAERRVTQLIDLKNRAVAQTADMADAVESIELMSDVRDQLQQLAQTFKTMRSWVNEIVAFEPVFARAMKSLQPLLQLGNLRHMNPTELRQVIRTMKERPEVELTGTPEDETSTAAEAAPSVPTLDKSAQAN